MLLSPLPHTHCTSGLTHTHTNTHIHTLWEHRWPHIHVSCQTDGPGWIHSTTDTHKHTRACTHWFISVGAHTGRKLLIIRSVWRISQTHTYTHLRLRTTQCFTHTQWLLSNARCPQSVLKHTHTHTDGGCCPITVPSVCLCESEMWSLINRTASILMRAILFHLFPVLLLNSLKFHFLFINTMQHINRIKGQHCGGHCTSLLWFQTAILRQKYRGRVLMNGLGLNYNVVCSGCTVMWFRDFQFGRLYPWWIEVDVNISQVRVRKVLLSISPKVTVHEVTTTVHWLCFNCF